MVLLRLIRWLHWFFNWVVDVNPPEKITNLRFRIIGKNMLNARIKLTWNPSPSLDVSSQMLSISFGDEVRDIIQNLPPSLDEFIFTAEEFDNVEVRLTAVDFMDQFSEAAVLSFNLGDLASPLPPSALGWQIVDIFASEDDEDEEELPPPPFPKDEDIDEEVNKVSDK